MADAHTDRKQYVDFDAARAAIESLDLGLRHIRKITFDFSVRGRCIEIESTQMETQGETPQQDIMAIYGDGLIIEQRRIPILSAEERERRGH